MFGLRKRPEERLHVRRLAALPGPLSNTHEYAPESVVHSRIGELYHRMFTGATVQT